MASGSSVGSTQNASCQPRSLPQTASSNYDENWRGARPKSYDTWRRQEGSRTSRDETIGRNKVGFDCLRAGASSKEEDNPDSRSRFRGDRPSNYRRGQRFRESPHTHQGYRNPNNDASWKRTGNRDEHSLTWRNQREARNSYGESRPFDGIQNRNRNKVTAPKTGTRTSLDQEGPADSWRSSPKSDNPSSRVEHSGSSQESKSSRAGVTPPFCRRPGKVADLTGANKPEDPRTEDYDLPTSSNSAEDDGESPSKTFGDFHPDESGRKRRETQQSSAQSPRKPQVAKRDLKTPPYSDRELRRFFVEKPTEVLTKLVAGKEKLLALLNLDELSADTMILTVRVLSCMWYLDPASDGLYTLELNTLLSLIESSLFLSKHLTRYLAGLTTSQPKDLDNDADDLQILSYDVKMIFELLQLFLQHKPSRSSDVGVPLILLQKVVTTTALNDAAFDPESFLMTQVQQLSECCNSLEQDQKRARQRAVEKPPPNNFRDIPVFPETTEIRQTAKPFLRKNIIHGRYDNVEHYLDVQFRLLRQDFVAPLREGVTEYLAQTTGRLQDIRLYYNVFIKKQQLGNSGVTHTLKFEMRNRNHRPEDWEKRLMYGSFVCLSNDDFQKILCATVENRNPNDLAEGSVDVRFLTKPPRTPTGPFIMAESTAYFEAYRHVLLGLQQINEESLPFKKYIVDVASSVEPPVYLRDDDSVMCDLRSLVVGTAQTFDYDREAESYVKAAFVPILYPESWPTAEELHLDESQKTALQTALTNEFSIIQGPPGTGKTFIGLKVIQILLDNSHLHQDKGRSPILVVCYTNHALDQFLEGIIALGEGNVVRVGGRSSSEVLESKNINRLRRKRSEHRRVRREFYEVREQLQEAEKTIKRTLKKLDVSRKVILNVMVMKEYMREIHYKNLSKQRRRGKNTKEDLSTNLLKWLKVDYSTEKRDSGPPGQAKKTSPIGEGYDRTAVGGDVLQQEHRQKVGGVANRSESSPSSERNLESQDPEGKDCIEVEDEGYAIQRERHIEDIYDLNSSLENHEEGLEEEFLYQFAVLGVELVLDSTSAAELQKHDAMTDEEAERIKNIWHLKIEDRWRLYRFWVTKYREKHEMEVSQLYLKCEALLNEMQKNNALEDLEILREANVIGMTTTGAAKWRSVLQRLGPCIVVVEEAAEVLEAHIVTTLTAKCQHLILIGDHQQLKPNPTVYRLARLFNLDTSLFERMINNGVPCKSLTRQHRMRPEISNLMKKHFYEKLQDDTTVMDMDNIKGVQHNMFFIDHQQLEDGVDDNRTRSNKYEAEILVELCRYLLHQDYKPSQITILTAYTGQLFCLRRLMDKATFEGVQVCVVDNFQGEENDIILLSLVRSNEEGSIGFLRTTNRVCVAFSRARMGFYCIGNATILTKAKLWQDITTTLEAEGRIGASLPLVCQNHPDKVTLVSTVKDFKKKVPNGGCDQLCGYVHPCGHTCQSFCHSTDPHHADKYKCQKPCERFCKRSEHVCPLRCHQPCEPCKKEVPKLMSECGHEIKVTCDEFDSVSCPIPCPRGFTDCSHQCRRQCGEECPLTCPEKCERTLSCGHDCTEECGRPCTQYCDVQVERTLKCGHKSLMVCSKNSEEVQCNTKVTKTRAICGHESEMFCFEDPNTMGCEERCVKTLRCGHQCPNVCGRPCEVTESLESGDLFYETEDDLDDLELDEVSESLEFVDLSWETENDFKLCKEIVEKSYPSCDHVVQLPCHQDIALVPCSRPCERLLACGHRCPKKCSQPCLQEKLDFTSTITRSGYRETVSEFCKETCNRVLPCGHPCPNKCGEPCPGASPKIGNHYYTSSRNHIQNFSVKCRELVQRKLPQCGHYVTAKCYKAIGSLSCSETCNKKLPCGHLCRNLCSKPCKCSVLVPKRLPNCEHIAQLLCYKDVSSHVCVEKCQRELVCGHQCPNKCSEPCPGEDEITTLEASPSVRLLCLDKETPARKCNQMVHKRCSKCGHSIELPCHKDVDSVKCLEKCERILSCGHRCPNKCCEPCPGDRFDPNKDRIPGSEDEDDLFSNECRDDLAAGNCRVPVYKTFLLCGHTVKLPCYENVNRVLCPIIFKRVLPCGHMGIIRCGELCLGENHTKRGLSASFSSGSVSMTPGSTECRELVRKKLPSCGHVLRIPCNQSVDSVICNKNCSKTLSCGHRCPNRCGDPCLQETRGRSSRMYGRLSRCKEVVAKVLPCGHVKDVACWQDVSSISCREPCTAVLNCGHTCLGNCDDCRRDTEHVPCMRNCRKQLLCGHTCSESCGGVCSPDCKKCQRRSLKKSGSATSRPCRDDTTMLLNGQCKHNMRHRQLKTTACIFPCGRRNPQCGHTCIGVCGEPCPPFCLKCKRREVIDSLPKGGIRPRETFIYLSDCKHLCETRFLDRMVASVQSLLGSGFFIIRPILCPKCKEPIHNCSRYKDLLQSICRLVDSAKRQCEEKRKAVFGRSHCADVMARQSFVVGKWIRCPQGHVFYQDGDDKPAQQRELRCLECSE